MSRKQVTIFGAGVLVGFGLGAVAVARAAPKKGVAPTVIRAQRFELVDEAGHVRASLGSDSCEKFGIPGEMTMLSLYGDKPKTGAVGAAGLGVLPDGGQILLLANGKEKTGIVLRLPSAGSPSISLSSGKDGKSLTLEPEE